MKLSAIRLILMVGVALSVSACSTKKLEEENLQLKAQVEELEQVKADYSDQIAEHQRLSEQQKQAAQQEIASIRNSLEQQLSQQVAENKALIQKLDALTLITLGEASLFASGEADLTPDGAQTVKKLAEALDQYPGYHIRVEGHTDSMPTSPGLKIKYPSNWELSSARASSVARYMIYGLNVDPKRLSVAGYAHYRPVADNSDPKGRLQNRRIRLVVFKELD